MKYAGIGSRETPEFHLTMMRWLGHTFAQRSYILRSGRAIGADQAFEFGARYGGGICELYTPFFNARWAQHASMFHPAWDRCGSYAKLLHGRNSAIMLGPELNDPVKFVVCWTKDGKASGGTGQALRIAAAPQYNIPVFNLFIDPTAETLFKWLDTHK